jgi:hypothetical protein
MRALGTHKPSPTTFRPGNMTRLCSASAASQIAHLEPAQHHARLPNKEHQGLNQSVGCSYHSSGSCRRQEHCAQHNQRQHPVLAACCTMRLPHNMKPTQSSQQRHIFRNTNPGSTVKHTLTLHRPLVTPQVLSGVTPLTGASQSLLCMCSPYGPCHMAV